MSLNLYCYLDCRVQSVRTKEEKEVLEHFAGVFTMTSAQTFKEIFSTTIEVRT